MPNRQLQKNKVAHKLIKITKYKILKQIIISWVTRNVQNCTNDKTKSGREADKSCNLRYFILHITARQKDYPRRILRTEKIQSYKRWSKEPYVRCFLWQNDPPTLKPRSNLNGPRKTVHLTLRTLGYEDGDGNENIKTATGLVSNTTRTAHFFSRDWTITMWKFLISSFVEGVTKQPRNFLSSFWTWTWFLRIQPQESSPTIDKVIELVRNSLIAMKTNTTQIHFWSVAFAAIAVFRS